MKATLNELGSECCFSHALCMWMSNCKDPPPLFLKKGDLENRAQLREPANILIFNTTRSDTAEYRCEVAAIDDQRDFDEILISLAVRGTVCRTPPRAGGGGRGQIYTCSLLGKVKIMTCLRNQKLKVTQRVENCTTQGWNGLLKQLKSNGANSPIRSSKFKVSRTVLRRGEPSTATVCLCAVKPVVPRCSVPEAVTVGTSTELRCLENEGFPAPQYRWFHNNEELPLEPKTSLKFVNSSYSINPDTGGLVRNTQGGYFCCVIHQKINRKKCGFSHIQRRKWRK